MKDTIAVIVLASLVLVVALIAIQMPVEVMP